MCVCFFVCLHVYAGVLVCVRVCTYVCSEYKISVHTFVREHQFVCMAAHVRGHSCTVMHWVHCRPLVQMRMGTCGMAFYYTQGCAVAFRIRAC